MALSFPYVWGSGGSGYVSDGLIMEDVNQLGDLQKTGNIYPLTTLSNFSVEICYSATAVHGTGNVGILLKFLGETIVLNGNELTTGSEYGIQAYYGTEYGATALIPIPNLVFGTDKHTVAAVQSGTRTNIYFDGELVGGFDNANGRTTITGQEITICRDTSYPVTGTWYDMRAYNRALTADEVAANYAEDMRRYG